MLYDPKWHVANPLIPKFRAPWRKILWDAANLIERRGWIQHRTFSEQGYCIYGAINEIGMAELSRYRHSAKSHLRRHLGANIATWNDSRARTKEQVLAKLREAALS
jgi:hypothetical protein